MWTWGYKAFKQDYVAGEGVILQQHLRPGHVPSSRMVPGMHGVCRL